MATRMWVKCAGTHWLLLAIVLAALLAGGCSSFGIWASKKIYPVLHPPEDKEPPSTFRMDPPSTQLSTLVGGQGGGISCSIPAAVKPLFFRSGGNLGDVNLRFRQACAMHDLCYRHGEATYNYSQADCDFALLESAFRICAIAFTDRAAEDLKGGQATTTAAALIGTTDDERRKQLAPRINETCPDQARLVLLGVRIGGGSSFKTGATSTYLDYDPMPLKANDYTVIRWLSDGRGAHTLGGHFYYFHYLHGRTSTTPLPNDDGVKLYEIPRAFVPTPATVVRGPMEDALFITARKGASNTWSATYHLSMSESAADKMVNLRGTLEPDSSITWVPSADGPTRLSHWKRYDATVRTCEITPSKGCINPQRSQALSVTTDTYRTLQHPPLRGRFLDDGCEYYAIPRRGGRTLIAGQPSDEGEGFKEYLGFLLAPVDSTAVGCRQGKGVVRDVPEALEPLGVFATPHHKDLLIGFSSDDPDDSESAMHARLFSLVEDNRVQRLQFIEPNTERPLTSRWLRRPVAIVRPDVVASDDTQIVMTKVEPDYPPINNKKAPRTSMSPESFWVDVLAFSYADRVCDVSRCTLRSAQGASCYVTGSYEDFVRAASGLTLPGYFDAAGSAAIARPLQIALLPKGKSANAFMMTLLPHKGTTSIDALRLDNLQPVSGEVKCQTYRQPAATLAKRE